MARLSRSRRPWRRVAVLAVLVGVGLAVATPVWWNRAAEPQRLRWTIEEAGADGRSLRIASGSALRGCGPGEPRPTVERDSADEIRIRLVAHEPVELGDLAPQRGRACPLIGRFAGSYTVRLDRPLGGRRVGGPGYRPRLAGRRGGPGLTAAIGGGERDVLVGAGTADRRATMVRVVGLRLDDARRLLRSRGILAPAVSGLAQPDAVVVGQVPAAGARLRRPAGDARRGRRGVVRGNAGRLVVRAAER